MTENFIHRERVREGVVECPLCGRQLAEPTAHLVAFGAVDELTAETADAIECPVCEGVTFIEEPESGG